MDKVLKVYSYLCLLGLIGLSLFVFKIYKEESQRFILGQCYDYNGYVFRVLDRSDTGRTALVYWLDDNSKDLVNFSQDYKKLTSCFN